jgi:hypothetical protein
MEEGVTKGENLEIVLDRYIEKLLEKKTPINIKFYAIIVIWEDFLEG